MFIYLVIWEMTSGTEKSDYKWHMYFHIKPEKALKKVQTHKNRAKHGFLVP